MYDPEQQLAFDSEFCVAVVGRGVDFMLIPVTGPGPIDEALLDSAARRGLGYCGVMGIVRGQAAAKCQPDIESMQTMMHAAVAFGQLIVDRLNAKLNGGDFDSWAWNLWALPDTRPEV